MWSSRGVEGYWGWVKKGVRLVLRVQRGTEGYRGVRCGNGTVPMKALLNVSVLNVNHPPDVSAFLDPIINLIMP